MPHLSSWPLSSTIIWLLISFLAAIPNASAARPDPQKSPDVIDCGISFGLARTDMVAPDSSAPFKPEWLPKRRLFSPLLADMKQPGFYVSFRHVRLKGRGVPSGRRGSITAALVAMGGDFDLWGLHQPDGCNGYQVGISAGVFSQFNLSTESSDLINSDFTVGVPNRIRRGHLSVQLRPFHQSSHLGNEFLLNNPEVEDDGLSFEGVDLLISIDGAWWRLYGGGGYIFHSIPDLDPGMAQWGLEFYGVPWLFYLRQTYLMPILAADFNALDELDWAVTSSLKGGIQWASLTGTHQVRFLLVYLNGHIPFGQFFNDERIENFGVEMQIGF